MGYRLGLDVGTASCGLIALELDDKDKRLQPIYHSLDIWSEPLLPAKSGGVGNPKKAERRQKRQQRRQIARRARRLRHVAHLSRLLGVDLAEITSDSGQTIHAIRAKASSERIELTDLVRVFLKLAKRRGYSGGFRIKKEGDKEAGIVEPGIQRLKEAMDAAGCETLGQYLLWRHEHGLTLKLKEADRDKGRAKENSALSIHVAQKLFAQRDQCVSEFDRIWDSQARFHEIIRTPHEGKPLRDWFRKAIFFQRPLRSPRPMVGHCPLEPTLPRAPWAQMAVQHFRIEKQIADLRWGIGRMAQGLSSEQKAVIRSLLEEHADTKFSTILQAIEKAGCPGPQGRGLNMSRASRDSLKGNSTLAVFRKLKLDAEWRALDERTQIQVINFLADLGSPDALEADDWDRHFETNAKDAQTGKPRQRTFSEPMVAFVNKLRAHEKFGRLTAMGFDGGRAGYSIKALTKLIALMQEGWDERAAAEQAYPEHFKPKPETNDLPLPEQTGNVVVDVALRQVYRSIRKAMQTLGGSPSEVVVELSRDMSLGISKRQEIEARISKNQKARKNAETKIKEFGEQPTERLIQRYLLWEGQLHYCPYCDKRIEFGQAMGEATEREHILPRSLTRVGGKRSQLVLAHRACNQEKGNRTPWQAFGADSARWRVIEERAEQLKMNYQAGKARLLLLKDWQDEVLDEAAISDFSDRQFHESSWIAKLTAQWLRAVCSKVYVSRGQLTAHLRRIWKLDTVIPDARFEAGLPVLDLEGAPIKKEEFDQHRSWWEGHTRNEGASPTERRPDKRIDHRHHLVDALVISLTSPMLYRDMALHYKLENEKAQRGERAKLNRDVKPPLPNVRDAALTLLRGCQPCHKSDRYPDGALFKETAYGLSRKPNDSGEYKLASRALLASLADKKSSVEQARNVLATIESETTRDAVLAAFDQRVAAGRSAAEALAEPIPHPEFQTPIRRVRLLGDSAATAAEITHADRHGTMHRKQYVHAGNAYLEVCVQDGKLAGKPRLVTVRQAMKEKGSRPPADVTRFWKGDTLRLGDGSMHVIGQITMQGGGQLRLVPITETCTFAELKRRGLTLKTISGASLASVQLVNV